MTTQMNCDTCKFQEAKPSIWRDVVGGVIVLVLASMLIGVTAMKSDVAVNTSDIQTLKESNKSADARAIRIEQKLDDLKNLLVEQARHDRK